MSDKSFYFEILRVFSNYEQNFYIIFILIAHVRCHTRPCSIKRTITVHLLLTECLGLTINQSFHFNYSLQEGPMKLIYTVPKKFLCIDFNYLPFRQSNVVYEITCSQCNLSYVGQTSRHLQQRFKEHIGSSGLLKKHFQDCDVSPSFEMVKILGKANLKNY